MFQIIALNDGVLKFNKPEKVTKRKKLFRALIIEDNGGDYAIVRKYMTEQFLHLSIEQAVDSSQAALMLSSVTNKFDVILYGIAMPDKKSIAVVYKILDLDLTCPLIILTNSTNPGFSIKSISQGVSDYLIKDELTASNLYKSILYAIERKNNLINLKNSEKRYSDLFDYSPQPMWVYDPRTFRFCHVNYAAIDHYGYNKQEFLQMTIFELRSKIDYFQRDHTSLKYRKESKTFKDTVHHFKKSGESVEDNIYCTPVIISNRKFISVIAIDVTENNFYERKILKAIIKTQEDERYELGSELHDNVCQILAASQVTLGILKTSVANENSLLFDRCNESITLALNEIRNLSHRLAPVFFDELSLEEAFSKLCDNFHLEKKFKILVHIARSVKKVLLSVDLQLNLYRIMQEQLRNIIKHSNGSRIELVLIIYQKRLIMTVLDNGIGFDPDTVKDGIGLTNIKRRAELFFGKVYIESSPGNGCKLIINIPLQNNPVNKKEYA